MIGASEHGRGVKPCHCGVIVSVLASLSWINKNKEKYTCMYIYIYDRRLAAPWKPRSLGSAYKWSQTAATEQGLGCSMIDATENSLACSVIGPTEHCLNLCALFAFCIDWMVACLIDCLVTCLVDWMVTCLVDWLNGYLLDWVVGCMVTCLIDCLAGYLLDWLIGWLKLLGSNSKSS